MPGGALEWVRAATLAPSSYNTQPWKFALGSGSVQIYPDLKRALGVTDPNHRELYISLGCALENLCLAAQADGFSTEVATFPADQRNCAARVEPVADGSISAPLAEVMRRRQTNRHAYDRRPLEEETIRALDGVECEPGVSVHLSVDRTQFYPYETFVARADAQLIQTPGYIDEILEWIRFNPKEAARTRDGIPATDFGQLTVSRWLGERLLRRRAKKGTFIREDASSVLSSSALAVISTEQDERGAWLAAGRTLERFVLTATQQGLQHAYLNQVCQVPGIREQLVVRLGPAANYPQIVLRLGYAPPAPRSLRRPLEDVLTEPEPTPLYVPPPSRESEMPLYP
jgi:hypothetical protein